MQMYTSLGLVSSAKLSVSSGSGILMVIVRQKQANIHSKTRLCEIVPGQIPCLLGWQYGSVGKSLQSEDLNSIYSSHVV